MLNKIKNLFFPLLIIGLFASWAQNEYGNTLIIVSTSGISIAFFIQAFFYLFKAVNFNRKERWFCFLENLSIGMIFYSFVSKMAWWPLGGVAIVLGTLLIFILYVFLFFRILLKKNKEFRGERGPKALILFIVISGLINLVFKVQHWPMPVLNTMYPFLLIALLFMLIYKWYSLKEIKLDFFSYAGSIFNNLNGQLRLVFSILILMDLFKILFIIGFKPERYLSKFPTEYIRLRNEGKDKEALEYIDAYEKFIKSRKDANDAISE